MLRKIDRAAPAFTPRMYPRCVCWFHSLADPAPTSTLVHLSYLASPKPALGLRGAWGPETPPALHAPRAARPPLFPASLVEQSPTPCPGFGATPPAATQAVACRAGWPARCSTLSAAWRARRCNAILPVLVPVAPVEPRSAARDTGHEPSRGRMSALACGTVRM